MCRQHGSIPGWAGRTSPRRTITSAIAGEPVIGPELSRTGADQPDEEEHVEKFRNVEQIVEPAEG